MFLSVVHERRDLGRKLNIICDLYKILPLGKTPHVSQFRSGEVSIPIYSTTFIISWVNIRRLISQREISRKSCWSQVDTSLISCVAEFASDPRHSHTESSNLQESNRRFWRSFWVSTRGLLIILIVIFRLCTTIVDSIGFLHFISVFYCCNLEDLIHRELIWLGSIPKASLEDQTNRTDKEHASNRK